MYNIDNMNYEQLHNLSKVHFGIIVPIVEHYKYENNIKNGDVTLDVVDNGGYLGKTIDIAIQGIPYNRIYNDIINDVFDIDVENNIYKVELTSNGYVEIILKWKYLNIYYKYEKNETCMKAHVSFINLNQAEDDGT